MMMMMMTTTTFFTNLQNQSTIDQLVNKVYLRNIYNVDIPIKIFYDAWTTLIDCQTAHKPPKKLKTTQTKTQQEL